mgnify:FL=1
MSLFSLVGAACGESADAWRSPYSGNDATASHVLGLWHFDTESTTSDASGRRAQATIDGATIHDDGRFGSCLESFAGWPVEDTRHAFVVPNDAELSPRGAFTLELWVKPKPELFDYRSNAFLIDKKYVAHTDYQLIFGQPAADGSRALQLSLGFGSESDFWSSDPVLLDAERWDHLAVTYDGQGTARFYLNGRPFGGGVRPGRGGVAAGRHAVSIGDRIGSLYSGFPGYIDEVRITTGVREFRVTPVSDVSLRRVFLRMEDGAALTYRITNALDRPVSDASVTVSIAGVPEATVPPLPLDIPKLAPGQTFDVSVPFDTSLRPGEYRMVVTTHVPGDAEYNGSESFPVTLVPRPLPHRMPVVMWGIGGVEGVSQNFPRLKEIGFTHCLGLSADYGRIFEAGQPVTAVGENRLPPAARMLDEALANDIGIVVSLSPGRWLQQKPEYQRIDRNGRPYGRTNLAAVSPEIDDFFYNVGASVAQTWDKFPALQAALVDTEIRDGTNISFHPAERDAFKQHAGFDVPQQVTAKWGVRYADLSDVPDDRVIPDDHPTRVFLEWFWKNGDGWNDWHSSLHRGFHSTRRDDLWTFFDPAVRVPSIWGSGGEVDFLSHWTYSYPDPLRIGLCADELSAMASGRPDQQIMKMTQLIWYRSQTAPAGKSTNQEERSPWEDYDPDAAYITIAPMHLREALWTKLSRPVKGIMYHGWQSLVPTDTAGAYRYTHPETQHELARLVHDVVQPLGPTLLQVPPARSDVAMLESFTSQMFAGRGTYGWGHTWTSDLWLALQHAGLQTEIIYEETLLRDGLDQYNLLVLPDCDVLPQSVADEILGFQQRGGIVVADDRLAPAIKPDLLVQPTARSRQADADKEAILATAEQLRNQLEGRYQPIARSTDPDVVPYVRSAGSSDYVFLVNDHREFGSYVGHHGLVMENGLPSRTELSLRRKTGHVYDLRNSRAVDVQPTADGELVWPVALGPCDGNVFLVTERPIARLNVGLPESATRRHPVTLRIQVTDESDQTVDAVVPVRLEIRDPSGRTAERSGYYGAAHGRLEVTLDLAPNDTPGVWQVHAEELAGGLTADAYFRVQ